MKKPKPEDFYRAVEMEDGSYRVQVLRPELFGEDWWETLPVCFLTLKAVCQARTDHIATRKAMIAGRTVKRVIDCDCIAMIDGVFYG